MKSSARITARLAAGFVADPDPSTNPADVPVANVFRAPESLPVDGAPNALLLWLIGADGAETASYEVWALDEDSAAQEAVLSAPFAPNANHRWTRLAAATVVTNPAQAAVTGRLFAGLLYLRQTASTIAGTAATLKALPARL